MDQPIDKECFSIILMWRSRFMTNYGAQRRPPLHLGAVFF